LRGFTRLHRSVDIELTVDLSARLFQALDAAELDLVLATRRPGEGCGKLVRCVRLVWIAADAALADPARTLPVILYPPPSTSRAVALEALERAGRRWRIVCLYQRQPQRPPCGGARWARRSRPV
jgi:DNA-binding transcriptional LysR family regulator